MDNILILFCIAGLVGDIPAKGFKERVNKLSSKLGFVIGSTSVRLYILLEVFNEDGYLS